MSTLPSPATRLSASAVNATRRPSALIEADDRSVVAAGMVTSWRMEAAAQTSAEHRHPSDSQPADRPPDSPVDMPGGCPASKVPSTRVPEPRLQLHSPLPAQRRIATLREPPPALHLPDRWPRHPSTHRDSWPARTEEHGEFVRVDAGTATVHAAWTGAGELMRVSEAFRATAKTFTEVFRLQETFRDATATGGMNGTDFGTPSSPTSSTPAPRRSSQRPEARCPRNRGCKVRASFVLVSTRSRLPVEAAAPCGHSYRLGACFGFAGWRR